MRKKSSAGKLATLSPASNCTLPTSRFVLPKLRFPEFRGVGEWKLSPLGALAKLKNGYAFKSSTYAVGDFRLVTIANVQSGQLRLDGAKSIATLPPDIQAHQRLDLGDILISMTGNVGRVCLVDSPSLLLNQRVGKLVPYAVDPSFFYQTLQREEFRESMQLKAAGGAQGNLSASDITSFVIFNPPNEAEQQKIADCLTSLDGVIAAQGRKVEALKAHKRGLMQQLFPREGETRPRLRFPEFRDAPEWDTKGLGELVKIRTGKKDANEGAVDGIYPFFTCAEEHIYSHSYSFDAEAILIAGNVNVGQARYYKGKFEAYQRTYVLMDFKEVFVPYLYALLDAKLRPALLAQVQTSAMSYIRLPMLEEFQVAMPPLIDEQQRVADCLGALDMRIRAEAARLAALKTHKQGLMQQLFPVAESVAA